MENARLDFWFWFGVWTSILLLIAAGTINFTGALPDAWVTPLTKWCAIFGAINNTILTAAKFRGYLNDKAAAIVPSTAAVAKVLVAAFVLSMFLAGGSAQAQSKLKLPIDPLGFNGKLTGSIGNDLSTLYTKLQAVSLVDLKYALNIANKKNNKAAGQCWQAIIDMIELDQTANLDADGKPLPMPDPRVFTDVERMSDIVNALGPNSPLMVGCGSFANQAKMNVLQMVTTIVSGAASMATFGAALAP
jgi:hypothetical protein